MREKLHWSTYQQSTEEMLTATNCYFHNKNVQTSCVILKRAQLIDDILL